MQIIIEGVSRCGKNSLAKHINESIGLTYWDNEHNTSLIINKDFHNIVYLESQVFKSFNNFIKTRYAISYIAFRRLYVEPHFRLEQLENSCDNPFCIYIDQDYEDYITRADEPMPKSYYNQLRFNYESSMQKSKFNWYNIKNNSSLENLLKDGLNLFKNKTSQGSGPWNNKISRY